MARMRRYARHVLALAKGVSTVGTPYSAGTPIIHLSSDACTGQSYTLTDDDARKLLAVPVEPFHSLEESKRRLEKQAATVVKRRAQYKVIKEVSARIFAAFNLKLIRRIWYGDAVLIKYGVNINSVPPNAVFKFITIGNGKIYKGYGKELNKFVELCDPECFDKLIELLK